MSTLSVAPEGAVADARALPGAPGATACPSCGAGLGGNYCPACGERNPALEDRSLRRFMREALHELSLDSKMLRTLGLLVTRPGALTAEYLRGRRRPYLRPLRLYLSVFAVALVLGSLLAGSFQPDSTSGFVQTLIAALQDAVAQARSITPAEAQRALDDRTLGLITWFSLGSPLVLAAFLGLVRPGGRRWFADHLVFATHLAAFNLTIALLFLPFQALLGATALGPTGLAALGWVAVYFYLALRRVYGTSHAGTALRTVLLLAAFSVAQLLTGVLALATAAVTLMYF